MAKSTMVALFVLSLFATFSGAPASARGRGPYPVDVEKRAVPAGQRADGPHVGVPVPAGSFDGDVRRLPQLGPPATPREAPLTRRAAANTRRPFPTTARDPVRQAGVSAPRLAGPVQSFDGLAFTGYYPPDPNGDVGLSYYVQAVNVEIGVFTKTGTLLASFTFDALFNGATDPSGNPCSAFQNKGDPIVLYDATVDRWLLADMAWASSAGPFYECIAVSQSGDPTGSWWLYAMPATDPPASNDLQIDYPKLGVWSDGYYMTANMFDSVGGETVRVWALNRDDLTTGADLRHVSFDLAAPYANLLPGNMRGSNPPPSGRPAFFASVDQPDAFHLWQFQVDWVNESSSTFSVPVDLTVASFVMPCNAANNLQCVPELSGEQVDALGDRLMMQLQYRNVEGTESLWAAHTVAETSDGSTPTGIRWYEIRDPYSAPTVYQQGTYMPNDSYYRWLPSLAVDQSNDMLVGFSISSSTRHPAVEYAGRQGGDPLGTLPRGEGLLIQGTGSQNGGFNRWGDYSAMTIDPTDDCTFWYTNEYYSSSGGWRTRIGSLQPFPACGYAPNTFLFKYLLPQILRNATLP
ncbi:MAG: hypothetical protein M1482_02155 [Chloroflexi bacterium]|nr:hypothetical protein [Chloroflexota bacterium]